MQEVPEGAIVITPKEFYDGVRADIAEIKAAVGPLPDMKTDMDTLTRRVDTLEHRLVWVSGFASAVSMAAGYFLAGVT